MGATLPHGARIRVAEGGAFERGTIVAFVANGKTFVHRVSWRGRSWAARGWLLTQGDALRLPDPPVHRDAVLGQVVAVERGDVWQPADGAGRLPRRERALARLLWVLCVLLLEVRPSLARWLIDRLRVAELHKGWTQTLLYPGANKPRRQRTSLTLATAVLACRLGAGALRAIRAMSGAMVSLWDSSQRLLGAACNEALTLDEKSRLTVRIYDFFPGYHRTYDRLHPWEGPWFERRLPAAGARVLVGGAGVGREAAALIAQGLVVDAFDPAPELVAACRRAFDARSQVGVMSYETFSSLVLDGAVRDDRLPLLADRYDAILLGSGSLTHVLDPREHQRLLRACAAVCPMGPILMSFYCADDSSDRPPAGRATRCGAALGRATATLRGMPAAGSTRLSYRPHGGFAYTFTAAEIEGLAASIGRDLSWEPGTTGDFRCVTFLLTAATPAPAP